MLKKNIVLLQTCLFCAVATLHAQFNVSLSFSSHLKTSIKSNTSATENFPEHKANDLVFNNQFQGDYSANLSSLRTVVIDAGHGGHDPGCLGAKSYEKDIALAIAKQLAIAIRLAHPKVKVILTRDKDIFIPLHKRAAIANRNKADLFISIHCNAMPPGHASAKGTETYVMGLHTAKHNLNVAKRENASILLEANYEKNYDYDPNSTEGHIILSMFQNAFLSQSILFAEKIEQQFVTKAQRSSRGVKQAGFVVLKETTMPSVLIETGFLTNKKEENYLRTVAGQKSVVAAISKAFTAYKILIDSGTVTNPVADTPYNTATKSVPAEVLTEKMAIKTHPHSSNSRDFSSQNTPKSPTVRKKVVKYEAPIIFYENATKKDTYKTYPGTKVNTPGVNPTYDLPSAYSTGQPLTTQKSPQATTPTISKKIQFRVQLAASPNLLNTMTPKWQNIHYPIEITAEGNLYKYQARNFANYQAASQAKKELRLAGFPEAFVVAYQNGKRVDLTKVKKP